MGKGTEPMVVKAGGLRVEIEYRRRGRDTGLSFQVYDDEGREEELLRFDCFRERPHYHLMKNSRTRKIVRMAKDKIPDPVRWTLDRLKQDLATFLRKAGHRKLSTEIRQQAVARALRKAELKILRLAQG